MCGASDNQVTKTKCMEQLYTQAKSRKQWEKERENTKRFVYPVWSKLT